MKKLVILYKAANDPAAFTSHFTDVHLPLVRKLPGLQRVERTVIDHTMVGDQGYQLLVQLEFADEAAFEAAMKSPENQAVGQDVGNFAAGRVTIMAGSVSQD